MKPTLVSRLLILATVGISLTAVAQTVRVVAVNGPGTVASPGKAPAALKANQKIQPGQEISTGAGAALLLQLDDGSTVEVYPGTRLIVQDQSLSTWRNFLEVVLGTVKIHVERLSGRPNNKSVTTPTAIIAVRGTTFAIRVDREATTDVGVDEGLVSVASLMRSDQAVILQPGFQTTVRQGQSPAPPQRTTDPVAPTGRFIAGNSATGSGNRGNGSVTSPTGSVTASSTNRATGSVTAPTGMVTQPPSPPRRPGRE